MSPQANLIGPPPRTREPLDLGAGVPLQDEPAERGYGMPPESAEFPSMQAAIMQQTQALLSHVLSQADGGLADLASGSGSSSSLASRGAAKRERLQQALSSRTGDFFLQVMQQVFRRLNLAELQGSPMMCRYLERFCGYAGQREAGYLMWMLAHVADALLQDDVLGAREHLALCLVCLDQSVLDGPCLHDVSSGRTTRPDVLAPPNCSKPAVPGFLSPVASWLGHDVSPILEGNRPHQHQAFGEPWWQCQEPILAPDSRCQSGSCKQATATAPFPSKAKERDGGCVQIARPVTRPPPGLVHANKGHLVHNEGVFCNVGWGSSSGSVLFSNHFCFLFEVNFASEQARS